MSEIKRNRIQELFESGSKDLTNAQQLPSEDPQRALLLDSALQSFEETVRINSRFILGYRKIILIHEDKGNEEEAIAVLERILELQPHDEAALLKISRIRKARGELEKADQIELQIGYQEVQEILKKYEDGVPDSGISTSIVWEGIEKPRLKSTEQIVFLFKEVDMTINRVEISNGTFIVTDSRIILEGMRIYGSQTGSAMARQYEQRRGGRQKDRATWPDSFLGLSLSFEEIDESKLVWLGRVPTLHLVFRQDGHAGISAIPSAMAEKVIETLDSHNVPISQERLKLCASWFLILLPLTSFVSALVFLI